MSTGLKTKELLTWLNAARRDADEGLPLDPQDIPYFDALIALVRREAERDREPSKVNTFGTLLETLEVPTEEQHP